MSETVKFMAMKCGQNCEVMSENCEVFWNENCEVISKTAKSSIFHKIIFSARPSVLVENIAPHWPVHPPMALDKIPKPQ